MNDSKVWGLGLLVYAGMIFGVSSIPGNLIVEPSGFWRVDLVFHFAEFGILGYILARTFAVAEPAPGLSPRYYWPILIGMAYACLDELHQGFVPGRNVEFSDFLADSLGVITGYSGEIWRRKRAISR